MADKMLDAVKFLENPGGGENQKDIDAVSYNMPSGIEEHVLHVGHRPVTNHGSIYRVGGAKPVAEVLESAEQEIARAREVNAEARHAVEVAFADMLAQQKVIAVARAKIEGVARSAEVMGERQKLAQTVFERVRGYNDAVEQLQGLPPARDEDVEGAAQREAAFARFRVLFDQALIWCPI
jgi:hypothetical protein